ncbi:MAG: NigD-like protein [Fermentimonas sp.]|nr:NigD-like protein [Fermentimonas sp.]
MQRKIFIFGIAIIGILLINIGCDDNSKSLGNFGIDIATIIPEGNNSYSLQLDNGKKLWPAAKAVSFTPAKHQRVLLNYTILSDQKDGFDHYIKINDIWEILTKQVVELNAQNEISIGNDPVKTNSIWIGGDYLNASFMFNYGGKQPHAINLVRNSLTPGSEQEDVIELEFRHNSYESQSDRLYEGFVCFDLRPLRVMDSDSVKISVKVKEWTDKTNSVTKETIYDVVYRYNQAALKARTEIPIPVTTSDEYY